MARLFVLSVSEMNPTPSDFIRWCNDNSGFVSIILFVATLVVAWAGGLFKLLRHKPRFVLSLSPGPTFACTYLTCKVWRVRRHADFLCTLPDDFESRFCSRNYPNRATRIQVVNQQTKLVLSAVRSRLVLASDNDFDHGLPLHVEVRRREVLSVPDAAQHGAARAIRSLPSYWEERAWRNLL